jgi:hypothetical protein
MASALDDTEVAGVAVTGATALLTDPLTLASAGGTRKNAVVARTTAKSKERSIRHATLLESILPTVCFMPGS